jgi:hypothetical protein
MNMDFMQNLQASFDTKINDIIQPVLRECSVLRQHIGDLSRSVNNIEDKALHVARKISAEFNSAITSHFNPEAVHCTAMSSRPVTAVPQSSAALGSGLQAAALQQPTLSISKIEQSVSSVTRHPSYSAVVTQSPACPPPQATTSKRPITISSSTPVSKKSRIFPRTCSVPLCLTALSNS